MNKVYYKRLLDKLKFHHKSIRDFFGKEEVTITLTKCEIDDLLFVWKNHAEEIFALEVKDDGV